nr:MAG TPA: hypothetical protein [Caudoviricetes sp.]
MGAEPITRFHRKQKVPASTNKTHRTNHCNFAVLQ